MRGPRAPQAGHQCFLREEDGCAARTLSAHPEGKLEAVASGQPEQSQQEERQGPQQWPALTLIVSLAEVLSV